MSKSVSQIGISIVNAKTKGSKTKQTGINEQIAQRRQMAQQIVSKAGNKTERTISGNKKSL